MKHLFKDFAPKANPEAVIQLGPVRFTVLTARLIRMEYDRTQAFEDRPTQVFWHRDLPLPDFKSTITDDKITIETEYLRLVYNIQDFGFYHRHLQIEMKENHFLWHYGQTNNTNLGGTVRTLDNVDGAIPLNPGLISRSGWSVVDDSEALVFTADGWMQPRQAQPGTKDFYFFGYGQDYASCIKDFQKISGQTPILPRFALGNWWSRYWAYQQDELLDLMHDFRDHGAPLSVCIIDMDWHIVDTGNESSGWTGYTWNKDLFPEPQHFLDELKAMGLKKGLNLHPASGVYPHEVQYPQMAERMGVDPESKRPIPFQIGDPNFAEAYFEILHHPHEESGVDFWWIDWQQGTESDLEGLDPLFWLNHLHFYDLARDGHKRPFIFSRWAGLGSQRYPIGFSGDTYVTWDTLHFQPYFTATAANVAYGWWSHDIGGHMGGIEEPELYLRWLQYGVFSPILRVHSTNNPFHERRPWGFDAEIEIHATQAFRLRHALIPYLYTASWKNYEEGILPIRPMYHLFPEQANAYQCPNEYTFGSELIACPFTTPLNANTRLSRQPVWLPEGDWFDFFSGDHYQGGGWYAIYGDLGSIPVFAKAGAIVPLGPMAGWGGIELPDVLTIHVFPGADNSYQLYEDDGETQAYQNGMFAMTTFEQTSKEDQLQFSIKPIEGEVDLLPANRLFKVIFHSLAAPNTVSMRINGEEVPCHSLYDGDQHQLEITDIQLTPTSSLEISLRHPDAFLHKQDLQKTRISRMLRQFMMEAFVKQDLDNQLDLFLQDPTLMARYADRMKNSHLLALYEVWKGKHTEKIPDDPRSAIQALFNQLYHA